MTDWRALHRAQREAHWCVPACVEIVRARSGKALDQKTLVRKLYGGKAGYSLEFAVGELGSTARFLRPDPDQPSTVEWIDLQLQGGACIVCLVYCEELVGWMARAGITLESRHGALDGVLHCIVLVESTREGILYLDPFFTVAGQPVCLPRVELARVLQSQLVLVP